MSEKLLIDIGEHATVEITGETSQEIIQKAAFWSSLPGKCPVCGKDVKFVYRDPKGFTYYGLRCNGTPAHETTFGVFQAQGKGLYYKESVKWEVAQRGNDIHESDPGFSGSSSGSNGTAQYPTKADHKRLDDLIFTEWKKGTRKTSYEEAVLQKFNVLPHELSIEQKEQILHGLLGGKA